MDYIYGSLDAGNIDYKGLSSKTAIVTVDNDRRTISVDVTNAEVKDTDSIRTSLPKDENGNYIDGDWILEKVIINDGKISEIVWTDTAVHPHIYAGAIEEITAENIKGLTDLGTTKSNKEITVTQFKNMFAFAYPKSMGDVTSIQMKDIPIELISGFTKLEMNIDDVLYNVYHSGVSSNTYTYIIKF